MAINFQVALVWISVFSVVHSYPQPQNGDGLEGLRRNIPGEPGKDYPIYSIDVLRKINPRQFGDQSSNKNGNGNGANTGGQQDLRGGRNSGKNGRQNKRNNSVNKSQYLEQVAQGQIPGQPGQDYPVNSVKGLKGKFTNLKLAPAHLITPDYPKNAQIRGGGNSQNRRKNQGQRNQQKNTNNRRPNRPEAPTHTAPTQSFQPINNDKGVRVSTQFNQNFDLEPRPQQPNYPNNQPQPQRQQQQQQQQQAAQPLPFVPTNPDPAFQEEVFTGNYCPGGSLEECINFCPSKSYGECTAKCGEEC
ncbi:hypothetical protein TCAL_15311 [Tigriopus californicus]|uniref:WAP domain-containing protein n=1 Tax=Tigriopus californicus TaxID=6832 RepID=A0A553PKK9_TIGCA|nr:activating signal cointegrator 1 complex subunit 2 homolog [Tigriopus californicus]TRY78220.1 hypothetical protein TCAL_15311 [Tigriopus californicus]